ncbi:Retrovirus-related Pol polyprotein, partial [Mucuna pruriens]
MQEVPKNSGMTVMKNQHDELVPMRIQNSWRVCIDYRKLNQENLITISRWILRINENPHCAGRSTQDDLHLPIRYLCIHTHDVWPMQCAEYVSTLHDKYLLGLAIELHGSLYGRLDGLENLSKVLTRCIDKNLVLNFEKCHFMVTEGIVLGHVIFNKGIKVDKSKIDIITSLLNPTFVREVHSFLGHVGFYRRFIKNFTLCRSILRAEEPTHICTYSPSTQLKLKVKLKDENTNSTFQVNGHQIKLFHEGPTPTVGETESISLMELALPNDTS